MRVRGIRWLHAPTARYAESVAFARDVLGLTPVEENDEVAVFRTEDGDIVEVFGQRGIAKDHAFMRGPVAGFEVDDVASARAELEAKGIQFIGPLNRHGSGAWTYFLAPDGHVYELTTAP